MEDFGLWISLSVSTSIYLPKEWQLFIITLFSFLCCTDRVDNRLLSGWCVRSCLQCLHRANPRYSTDVIPSGYSWGCTHTMLISLLATGRKGSWNYCQYTWGWLFIHSSYFPLSLSSSFSFLHSSYPECLILQLRDHHICPGHTAEAQEVQFPCCVNFSMISCNYSFSSYFTCHTIIDQAMKRWSPHKPNSPWLDEVSLFLSLDSQNT